MSDIKKVTIVGATGHLGQHILTALLSSPALTVQILTRTTSTSPLPPTIPATTPIIRADYSSISSLKSAFSGQDAIVSVVGLGGVTDQINMIDAALAVGVKRFIPSEFGNHPELDGKRLPETRATQTEKKRVMRYLGEVEGRGEGNFSWTAIAVGNFFDWSIKRFPAFGFHLPTHTARIYDSGTEPFTGVLIASIGQAVVGTLLNPTPTANKFLRIRSLETNQNEILAAFERVTAKKWTVERISTKELYRAGQEKLAKGDMGWVLDVVVTQIFEEGKGRSVVVSREEADNGLVGVEEVEVEDVVRDIVRDW
ncbi:hypothetical protein FQN52_004724 [Onygenales sp. PD_12]|nr:hypothetical protein FQN52_004724 [Onygenales sp. PD_12]